jgi:hypothetical protein
MYMMIVCFLLFVYIWITVGDLIIKRQRVGIPFTNLTSYNKTAYGRINQR